MNKTALALLFVFLNLNIIVAQYCSSSGTTTYGTSTTRVVFNTIDNSTAKPSGYNDYTTISTTVSIGSTYNLSVQVNTDGNYTLHSMVWIDWNRDNDFADAGESFSLGTATNVANGATSLSPLSVLIPATATSGTTRMRVSTKYNAAPTSCEASFDGEVEDYSLNVVSSGGSVTFYNQVVSNGYTFFNNIRTDATPRFTISSSLSFNAIQFEMNTESDFTGTSYIQTISTNAHNSSTHYDFLCDNISPALPTVIGNVYYVRSRVSNNGGTNWGSWSSQHWSFTYDTSNYGWYQTSQSQFEEGISTGNFIYTSTTGTPADYLYMNRGSFDMRAGTDDGCKECVTWYPSVNYMTIGYQNSNCTGDIHNGTRFTNVPIPNGSDILSATYSLDDNDGCLSYDNATVSVYVSAYDIDNAPILSSSLDTYTETSNTVNWNMTFTHSDNGTHTLSGVDNVVEEVISRAGWNENNALTLLVNEVSSEQDAGCVSQADNGSSTAPRLSGTFTNFNNYWLSPAIEFLSLNCTSNYENLLWDADLSHGELRVQLYYDNSGSVTLVPDAVLPGNLAGFTSSPINISSLNIGTYQKLYIKAILKYTSVNNNESPKLNSWAITSTPNVSADLGPDKTICPSTSTQLNFTGCGMIVWNTGDTSSTITVNPTDTTVYYVTATAGNGDIDKDTVIVNVLPNILATESNNSICDGGNLSISAQGSGNFTWTSSPVDASLVGQENASIITISPSTSTTYTLTDNLCSTTDDVTITVNPLPTITALNNSPVCEGSSLSLTGGSGTNIDYEWTGPNSFSNTTQSPTVSSSATTNMSGDYYLTITDANNCTNTSSTTVVVNPLPLVYAGADKSINNGTSTSITDATVDGNLSPTGYNYSWTPNASLVDASVLHPNTNNLSLSTVFTLTATNQTTNCSASDDITITIIGGSLSVIVGNDTTICSGNTVDITAFGSGGSGTYTYSWSSNPVGFTSTDSSISVSPNSFTSYTVIVDDGYNTQTETIVVNVNYTPNVNASGTSAVCEGGTIHLNENTPPSMYSVSYSWIGPNSYSMGGQDHTITLATLSMSGNYIVFANANGCSNSDTVTVTVNPNPIVSILASEIDSLLCFGDSVSITVSGNADTYSIYDDLGNTFNSGVYFIPDTSSTYYVDGTFSSTGCSSGASVPVFVNPNLFIDSVLIVNETNCISPNGEITLYLNSETSPYHYSIDNGINYQTVNSFNGLTGNVYYISVRDSNLCFVYDTVSILSPIMPVIDSIQVSHVNCNGDNTGNIIIYSPTAQNYSIDNGINMQIDSSFIGIHANIYSIVVEDPGFCRSYGSATINEPTAIQITDSSFATICDKNGVAQVFVTGGVPNYFYLWSNGATTNSISHLTSGTYNCIVTDANLCTKSVNVHVADGGDTTTINFNALNINCFGDNTGRISASLSLYDTLYQWTWSHDLELNDSIATNLGSDVYSVTITSLTYDCTVIDSIEISQPSKLLLMVTDYQNPLCFNQNSGFINIGALDGTPPYSYNWTNGNNSESAINLSAGMYDITVTDINGCIETIDQTLINPTQITISDSLYYQNHYGNIILNVSGGTPGYSYNWSNNNLLNYNYNLAQGVYSVTVSDANGCESFASFTLEVPLIIPSIITPNNDNKNDKFNIIGIETINDVNIQIFNRWGDLLFIYKGTGINYLNEMWDGTHNGKFLPSGTYVYIVEVKTNDESKQYNGAVNILY